MSSPGGLPRGVDASELAAGTPTYAPRSLHLATAVSMTGLTRAAGTGMPELREQLDAAGMDPVSFSGTHGRGVTVTVTHGGPTVHQELKGNEALVFDAVQRAGRAGLGSGEVAEQTGLSQQQSYRALRKLVDAALLRRIGSTRTTRYFVK